MEYTGLSDSNPHPTAREQEIQPMERPRRPKARGADDNPPNRFHRHHRERVDDGWPGDGEPEPDPRTRLQREHSRSVITRNRSPDVPFDRSINPYRGCEHGCIYCYARPSHAWMNLSPGLDFETRLFCKPDAPQLLQRELARPGYRPAPVALGSNTDAYQRVEREQRITRRLLEVLDRYHHPVCIVTKSALIERDLDLLAPMAARGLARCAISLTTLDPALARVMEPRAANPARRLKTIRRLAEAGIPVTVLVAPVVPVLTDSELEALLTAARDAGAGSARMTILRLPREVAGLFGQWLHTHFPDRAGHVLNRIRDLHDGDPGDNRFGRRMTGSGVFADLIARRFELATRRLGLGDPEPLRHDLFRPPSPEETSGQLPLPGFQGP